MRKTLEKSKGITLIALIITIIVLLILAGVSLNLLAGNNGILKRATSAVSDHTDAQKKEEVEMAVADLEMKFYSEPQEKTFFEYLLENYGEENPYITSSEGSIEFSKNEDEDIVEIKYVDKNGNESYFEIGEDGKIELVGKSDGAVPDTKPPVVTLIKTTTSLIRFTATDKRSVVAYAVTETNSEPTEWTEIEKAKSYTEEVTGKKSNTTYYIWAKDGAGNVSEGKEAKTIDFEAFSYETSWNGAKATITVKTPSTGVQYKIGTTSTWTSYSETSKPQVDSGTIVYFQVTDGTNTKSYSSITPLWTGTVTYDANGGTGAPSSVPAEHKSTVTVDFSNKPTRTKYNFLGWATTSNATTATYTETGTKTFSMPASNVILYAVWETAGVSVKNYGDYVDLETSYVTNQTLEDETKIKADWRIFYKDSTDGVYLILADYLPYSYENTIKSGLSNYSSKYTYNWISKTSRIDLLDRLNNSSAWNKLISSKYIAKGLNVKGAIDLETWVQSWNASGYTKLYTAKTVTSDGLEGYYIGVADNPQSTTQSLKTDTNGYNDTLYFTHKSAFENAKYYWLTAPSATNTNFVFRIVCLGEINCYQYSYFSASIRPCVYIPSDVDLTKGSDGIWRIQ